MKIVLSKELEQKLEDSVCFDNIKLRAKCCKKTNENGDEFLELYLIDKPVDLGLRNKELEELSLRYCMKYFYIFIIATFTILISFIYTKL